MTLTDCTVTPVILNPIPPLRLSRHARQRLQERDIPALMIPLLHSYGHAQRIHKGHQRWQFTAREFGRMQQSLGHWLAEPSVATELPCLRRFLAHFTTMQIEISTTYRFHPLLDPATRRYLHTELAVILPDAALRRTTLIESCDGQIVTVFRRQRKTPNRASAAALPVAA